VNTYPYEPGQGQALLAGRANANGFKALLRGVAQTDPKEIMVAIQGQLNAGVGVEIEIAACRPPPSTRIASSPWWRTGGEMDYAGCSPRPAMPMGHSPSADQENWPPTNFTIALHQTEGRGSCEGKPCRPPTRPSGGRRTPSPADHRGRLPLDLPLR